MQIADPKHYDFLKGVSIFKNLTDGQLKNVVNCLFTKEVEKGEIVFSRLERENILYVVRYGELILENIGNSNLVYKKGDVFGEIAVINNNLRTGTIRARESCLLYCLCGEDLTNTDRITAEASLKIILELARRISSYLENAQNFSTERLIELGENEFVEFKSTLRYNLHTKKTGKEIEHAVLKTLAAFMNSSGGTLIIGVDDQKQILGLGNDRFKDDDHMLLHLTKLVQERISVEHAQFIKGTVEQSNGMKVLRIDVKPATKAAYVTFNNEEMLYIRTGPASTPLRVSEVFSFVRSRFH